MINKTAIVAGQICLDVIPDRSAVPEGQFNTLIQPEDLVHTQGVLCNPGGAVGKTGLVLHRLGVPVRLIGKIGHDLIGQTLLDLLRAEAPHLADDLVIDLSLPTSVTIVIDSPGSDRSFLYNPGANNTFYASDLPRPILEGAHLFHFGNPTLMRSIYRGEGAELVSILQRARRAGLSTSLDVTLPDPSTPAGMLDWPTILANTLPLVDLFVPKAEELVFLLDRETYDRLNADSHTPFFEALTPDMLEALAETVLSYGVKALLVNLGHRGLYLRTAPAQKWDKCGRGLEALDHRWHDRQLWAPAFNAPDKTTTGAGDTAVAGFLASILQGSDPQSALQISATAGALSLETADADSGLTGWDEIWARIEGGWKQRPLNLEAPGWDWDQDFGLWQKQSLPKTDHG